MDDFAQTDPVPVDSCESDADIQDHLADTGLADMYWVLFFLYSSFFPCFKVHGLFVAV